MKFLGWMHPKMRKNSTNPLKNFAIGNFCTCLSVLPLHDDQQSHVEQNTDIFQGFLTIGTLGINEPPTPTFAESSDEATEVTANEVKFINDELEKFLLAEEECANETFKKSHVSNQTEADLSKEYEGTVVCPLQGYLFGSSVQLLETKTENNNNAKAYLADSFQETKEVHASATYVEKSESEDVKRKSSAFKNPVKKILRKLGGEVTNAVLAKKIFQKIPQVFHRKIHPGNSIAIKERDASQGYAYSKNDEHRNSTGDSFSQEDGRSLSHGIQSKERINTAKFSDLKEDGNSSDKLQGHWIKTDADYLVLELK